MLSSFWKAKKLQIMAGILGIVLLAVVGVVLYQKMKPKDGVVTTISKASLEKMIEIDELSTLTYLYNATVPVYKEDSDTVKYYVAYEGKVTAGVDTSKISVTVDDEVKRITIVLPDAQIQGVTVDMGTLDFIFEKDKYHTETVSQEAYQASVADLEKRAGSQESLLSIARENAVHAVEALTAPWISQVRDTYTVEIK